MLELNEQKRLKDEERKRKEQQAADRRRRLEEDREEMERLRLAVEEVRAAGTIFRGFVVLNM